MVKGTRLQNPPPNASAAARGVAPNPSAQAATTTTPSTANTHASGNQRSPNAAQRSASRSGQEADDPAGTGTDIKTPSTTTLTPQRERDPGEDRRAHPVVVQECAEAGIAVAPARDRELPRHQRRRHRQRPPVRRAELRVVPHHRQGDQERRV